MAAEKKKLEWAQSLRGVGALLVVFCHLWLAIQEVYGVENSFCSFMTVDFLDAGKIGVSIFFFLCGYFSPELFEEWPSADQADCG